MCPLFCQKSREGQNKTPTTSEKLASVSVLMSLLWPGISPGHWTSDVCMSSGCVWETPPSHIQPVVLGCSSQPYSDVHLCPLPVCVARTAYFNLLSIVVGVTGSMHVIWLDLLLVFSVHRMSQPVVP